MRGQQLVPLRLCAGAATFLRQAWHFSLYSVPWDCPTDILSYRELEVIGLTKQEAAQPQSPQLM